MTWQEVSLKLSRLLPLLGVGLIGAIAWYSFRRRHKMHVKGARAYRDAKDNDMIEPLSLHPEIDPMRCAGCGACVKACPEGDIIQMINHKAVLTAPTKCVGHGECEISCPFNAISLVFGTKTRGMDLPRITTNYETNVPGLYISGELGGMGLIRNAIKQGKLAAEHAVANIPRAGPRTDTDILVIGAGAAGLSAALAAVQAKVPYICIEQNSVGGTIYNFPRQKVVMTQPAFLPLVGEMKFGGNKVSKEELLAYWTGIRRQTGLKIKEGCKFISLKKDQHGVFHVETSLGKVTAKKVMLCMGVRGSPRKLGLLNEDMAKVTYNLLDPDQYRKRHVAVVGGGNAAVEAAQYLAKSKLRNHVTLLVRSPKLDRCNQENQDIINAMAKQGQVTMRFNTTVKEIHKRHLVVEQGGKPLDLQNHYLFVFAGAEMPFKFLESIGIKIDRKFGEPVKKA